MGANKYVIAAKVLAKLPSFIDRENQPEGINFAKLLYNALVRHNYSALGELHKRTLFIGLMHFQDKYNHDEERLRRCDIHYLTPDNRIIPFCAFNVLPEWYRDAVQAKFGIPVEEWEKKTGKTLEQGLYRGTLRRGQKAVANCAVGALTGQKQDHKVVELQVKQ
jgi:Predicted Fe-S oxidoreductases